ncbi:hypothetical protein LSH36_583g02096 [Paralvinella palmiformis]|uniref:Aspartate-semialdehyde dehydrogenase n=1 Tax=Paralvinella palmiformis TaxID=53620 RepID=A0AAD9J5I3_9ANNE|nr:hypothetical protein LSH36_583g02096 [Paralvinella palmiformis]
MNKIPVAILGATGAVGQKFILLLSNHPQFVIHELVASEKNEGKRYQDAVHWIQSTDIPPQICNIIIKSTDDSLHSPLLFSGLSSNIAGPIETKYAQSGHIIMSNAQDHRMDDTVPLIIPEINHEHFELIHTQPYRGKIITNSNCVTMLLSLVLAPLHTKFGIDHIAVTTMQAVSGAGYPGVPSFDIMGNILPYIPMEEEKIESEPQKILGTLKGKKISPAPINISAQCYRTAVRDGHTFSLAIKFKNKPKQNELENTLTTFIGYPQIHSLYSAPSHPVHVSHTQSRPQPLLDASKDRGMVVTVGRIRSCTIFDYKMTVVGHNTIRGAAGASILNAECYLDLGYPLS